MNITPLSHCLLCNAPSVRSPLCQGCINDLPLNIHACWQCALPLPQPGICPECQQQAPAFNRSLAAFSYQPPITQLIALWKHRNDGRPFRLMAETLRDYLLQHYQHDDWPQALVPVPLHRYRLIQRGFHQTGQLTSYLGRQLGIPVHAGLISKSVSGHSQQGLDRAERLNNLRGAFRLTGPLPAPHIAVVDDVMTTGATARSLAELLVKAGAKRVDIWLLARTP